MTNPKLVKKLVLVLAIYSLPLLGKIQKLLSIITNYKNNPGIVPGLNPDAATIEGKIIAWQTKVTNRDNYIDLAKQMTAEIHEDEAEIIAIFEDSVLPQTTVAINGNEALAKQLGLDIKRSGSELTPILKGTQPIVSGVDFSMHSKHIISIIDKITKKKKLPRGILQTDIYAQIGGSQPADLEQLLANGGKYLGQADKGYFEQNFQSADTGKIVYYIAVFISAETKKIYSQSKVAAAMIS